MGIFCTAGSKPVLDVKTSSNNYERVIHMKKTMYSCMWCGCEIKKSTIVKDEDEEKESGSLYYGHCPFCGYVPIEFYTDDIDKEELISILLEDILYGASISIVAYFIIYGVIALLSIIPFGSITYYLMGVQKLPFLKFLLNISLSGSMAGCCITFAIAYLSIKVDTDFLEKKELFLRRKRTALIFSILAALTAGLGICILYIPDIVLPGLMLRDIGSRILIGGVGTILAQYISTVFVFRVFGQDFRELL